MMESFNARLLILMQNLFTATMHQYNRQCLQYWKYWTATRPDFDPDLSALSILTLFSTLTAPCLPALLSHFPLF